MFTTEQLLKCVISLFEDKIRLLTGQDEVTNTLVDRVACYIKAADCSHFAIEQLGLTWEDVSMTIDYCVYDNHEQVRCEDFTERNTTRNDVLIIRQRALLFHSVLKFL